MEDGTEESKVKDLGALRSVVNLLELDEREAEKALCSRVVAARGEVMQKGHSVQQAVYGKDAFAKVSCDKYQSVFLVLATVRTCTHYQHSIHEEFVCRTRHAPIYEN